jgi:hypothetical protein
MWELYHGGWAAPNIHFLGAAGCVKFGGLRIAGLSGIYKQVPKECVVICFERRYRCVCSAGFEQLSGVV